MLTELESKRIDLLRFPLILGVIFIHNITTSVSFSGSSSGVDLNGTYAEFIIYLISDGIADIAVPLFFLFSGFFFFNHFNKLTYPKKLSSRVKTLLIPYLFWNTAVLLLLFTVHSIPELKALAAGKGTPVTEYGPYDLFVAYTGFSDNGLPIAYQFWFIRDLMLACLFSPVFYLLARYIGWISVAVVTVIWLSGEYTAKIPDIKTLLFFLVGAVIQIKNQKLFYFDKYGKYIASIYALLLITSTAYPSFLFHKVTVIIGVVSALYLSKYLLTGPKKTLEYLGSISFFIFAAHEPTLNLVRKVSYKAIQPDNIETVLLLYFINPLIVVCFCIFFHWLISVSFPKLHTLTSGNRTT